MKSGSKLSYYYVTLAYDAPCGTEYNYTTRIKTSSRRSAILKATQSTEKDELKRVTCGEPIPLNDIRREIALNRRKAQRKRRQDEKDKEISVYLGDGKSMSLYEYNQMKAIEKDKEKPDQE